MGNKRVLESSPLFPPSRRTRFGTPTALASLHQVERRVFGRASRWRGGGAREQLLERPHAKPLAALHERRGEQRGR